MKVAIVGGTGAFGLALARRLARRGHEVVVGSRDAERAQAAAAELGVAGRHERGCRARRRPRRARGQGRRALETAHGACRRDRRDAGALRRERPPLHDAGVLPGGTQGSLAERIADRSRPVASGLHSLAAATLARGRCRGDALVCGDDADGEDARARARGHASSRAARIDAGPLANARALEGLTAVILNVNKRYKAHAGIQVTGLP